MADEALLAGSSAMRRSLQSCNGATGHPYVFEKESPPRSPPARDPSADGTPRSQTVQEDDTNSSDSGNHYPSQQISEFQYYTHRDDAHTICSKKEVQHFLDKGENKGKKELMPKKLADDPSGQSSGTRHSIKRTMLLPVNNDPPKRPTEFEEYLRRPRIGGMFRDLTRDQYPPGFL